MKQKLITSLVLGAIASFAVTGAYAGQIQASSVSIAREVITTNAQAVLSPSIAYRFAGDVDARAQSQTFQVQFTLGAGAWAALPANIAQSISVTDGVDAIIQEQVVGAVAPAVTNASYQVVATGRSADNLTLWATITVNQGVAALVKQPIIAMNVTSNNLANVVTITSAFRASVTGLFTVVGDLAAEFAASPVTAPVCFGVRTMPVNFQHFVALTAPAAIATTANATADEHTRGGATNNATLITFPTNLLVNVASSAGQVSLTPGGNMTFALAAAGTAFVDANNALLGTVAMTQNASGYDSNLVDQYLLAGGGAGVLAAATAVNNIGRVEATDLTVTVAATQGFVVGGTLALNTAANCAVGTRVAGTGTVAITAGNAAGPIPLVVPTAALNAALGAAVGTAPVFVCYTNPGTATIPSSQFSAVARLTKAAAGANVNEQNNTCRGNYISLGGGIKIDVRNYASSAETSGYQSVIRLINTSDASTADVWAQIIHQNGQLGGWGLIATLAPRQIRNMTAAQVDALLIGAPAAAPAANNGAVAPAAAAVGAPRLRITSQAGTSLRVQNYLFNSATGQILEGSGGQGVDFDGSATRAPASDGQYISQDAQSGLNLQR